MVTALLTDILIIILTTVSALLSGNPFPAVMLGGLMLMAVTAGSIIEEDRHKILIILQVVIAVCFALVSGGWWGFVVFACINGIPERIKVISAAAGFIAFRAVTLFALPGDDMGREIAYLILALMMVIVSVLLVIGIRRLSSMIKEKSERDRKRVISAGLSELHEKKKSQELVRQNYYAEKNARLIERENISRNIHNSVGHSITAAIMTLDAADMLYEKDPEAAREKMNDAGQRIRGSLDSIRSAVRALDEESKDTDIKDMICYIDNIIENFTMDTTRKVHKLYDIYSDEMKIPGEHAEFLTGVLQELLTNGVKHGNATEFSVILKGDSGHITLSVKDNGESGFSEETKDHLIEEGFGLKKIISYVERCGGRTSFDNDDGGFDARVELPI